jgi:hypothetical protein
MNDSSVPTQENDPFDATIKLQFEAFNQYQMGRGFVAYQLSEPEKKDGEYNPHVMFVHQHAESDDADMMKQVEQDCRDLTRLLNQFGIDPDSLSVSARKCNTKPAVEGEPKIVWAKVKHTHGTNEIAGTMIHVMATLASEVMRDGYVSTQYDPELKAMLKTAREKVIA